MVLKWIIKINLKFLLDERRIHEFHGRVQAENLVVLLDRPSADLKQQSLIHIFVN
jgi:hypothetical protein